MKITTSLLLATILYFSLQSTVFSQEKTEEDKSQKQVLIDMLHKMDENKDGKLTLGEAKGELYCSILPHWMPIKTVF